MFWGQPYCSSCGHVGPDLMWMWHHGIGLDVLVQDRESLALRVIEIADDPVFYRAEGQSPEQRARASKEHVDSIVARHIRPGEMRIFEDEIRRWEFEDHGRTTISCPGCRQILSWRGTGIS